jgi:alpha-L-rhamnosidase
LSSGQWSHRPPSSPGFQRIRFEPQVVRDLKWASASVDTVRGLVASSWTRDGDSFRLEVTIPVGSEAEIRVPKLGRTSVEIRESGKPIWTNNIFQAGVPGLTGAKQEDRTVIIQAGSGRYVFEIAP